MMIWSDPVDKVGGLPGLAAKETGAEAAVTTDGEEVRLALVEVRAAVLADMVVDAAGKVSWWLTQLGADVEVSADTEEVAAMEVGETTAWCSCSWCIAAKSKEVARAARSAARRAATRVGATTDAEAAAQVKATAEAEATTDADAAAQTCEGNSRSRGKRRICRDWHNGGGGSVSRGMQVGCKVGSSRGVERRGGFSSR